MYTFFLQAVADFLWEYVICQHDCFGKLIIDQRPNDKDVVVELVQKYKLKRVVVWVYQP